LDQLKEITRIIRYANPDVIITHYPGDYCSDHVELSKIVFKASFDASCPHYFPELGPASKVASLFYADTSRGHNFLPTEYVDITEEMELKAKMLECHESQLVWLRDHDGIDIVENRRVHAAFRGEQCGVKYAEAFCQFMGSQRVKPYRLLP
jgi:LmbE family N-acetylglucosaminyl deacetylase